MKLRESRKRKLLTVAELAALCGVSTSAINKIEQGAWLPSMKTIRKITSVLRIDPIEVDEFKAAIEK
jgi:transcriptional regulator with XRE-family HTH domain